MATTHRYTLRTTKVRNEKNKNIPSSMKDDSLYDIERKFIMENIDQLRRSTLSKQILNLECALKDENEKTQLPDVLNAITNLQETLKQTRQVFDKKLIFFQSEKRRLEKEKNKFLACSLCDFECKDKSLLNKHKLVHRNKRKMGEEKRESKKQKVLQDRVSSTTSEDEEDRSSWNKYLPLVQADEDESRSGLMSTHFVNVNMIESVTDSENETLSEMLTKTSKRPIIIDSESLPEPKHPKLTISHDNSSNVSNGLVDSELNNRDEYKNTEKNRSVKRISLRNFKKESSSKNDKVVDEDMIFIEKVKEDRHLIQTNQMDELRHMRIFSKDASVIGRRIALKIKKENTPNPDKANL